MTDETTPASEATEDSETSAPETRTRSPWLKAAWLAVALIVAWLLIAGWSLRSGVKSTRDAQRSLDEFSVANDGGLRDLTQLLDGDLDVTKLRAAGESFRNAHRSLDSRFVSPLTVVPVIGRQIRSARAMSHSAEILSLAIADTADEVTPIIERSASQTAETGAATSGDLVSARLDTARQIEAKLKALRDRIEVVDLGPTQGLISSLANTRHNFVAQYSQARSTLDDAITGVTGTLQFLTGPNRYLVMASNNAEMRAGSGMFLQIGAMDVADGGFTLSSFEASEDMKLSSPGATLTADLVDLWGPLEPTQEWRNLNLTPRFDESARMASQMWGASGRGEVQGVMAVDVAALRHLLELVGPVQVTGFDGTQSQINAANVEYKLMLEQYLQLDQTGQDVRRAHLGDVAAAIFKSLNSGKVGLADLIDTMLQLGRGRHLMMWSTDRTQQDAWEALGLSGKLEDHDLLVSVINRAGNKLDQFLNITAGLEAETKGDMRSVSVKLSMENTSPTQLPAYMQGPFPGTDLAAGDYYGYLSITIPGGSGNPSMTGAEVIGTSLDGPTKVVVARVLIHRKDAISVTLRFDLPVDWKYIDIRPSARIPQISWTVAGSKWPDAATRRITLK